MTARTGRFPWLFLVAASACALTSKSEPIVPRYYDPDLSDLPVRPAAADVDVERARASAKARVLRLGRVTAAAHLGERLVFRNANRELGFYEERRWTESPDAYLHRALAEVLFEREGIRRLIGGPGVTLDVELVEFEEIKKRPPVAHARATLLLHEGKSVLRERTVDVERAVGSGTRGEPGDSPDVVVHAMSLALGDLVNRLAAVVILELDSRAAAHPQVEPD